MLLARALSLAPGPTPSAAAAGRPRRRCSPPPWPRSAILGFLVWLRPLEAPNPAIAIPWWLVAIGFCLVDLKVIEVHFRRESHAFSLYEMPAIIGLFVLSPAEYLLAVGVGGGRGARRHEPVGPDQGRLQPRQLPLPGVHLPARLPRHRRRRRPAPGVAMYAAAFAASGVATLVGALTIASAITFSGGAPQFEKLPEMLQFGTLVAVANTSIALLAVILLWSSPAALWLLLLPVGTLFLAYRAWVSEREKHERLELVYQSSRILQHSPELDVALLALLDHARAMFRAEIAEVVLETGGEGGERGPDHVAGRRAPEAIVPISRRHP